MADQFICQIHSLVIRFTLLEYEPSGQGEIPYRR